MKRKVVSIMLSAIVGASFLAGCGGNAAKTSSSDTAAAGTSSTAVSSNSAKSAEKGEPSTDISTASNSSKTETPDIKGEISICVPSADHGWTGAVLHAAQEEADKLQGEGIKAVVYAATDEANQIQQVEDLIARGSGEISGIAILPYDNGLQATLEKVSAADIPFAQFDRLIDSDAMTTCVAKVVTDNVAIGYKSAERFAKEDGMTADSTVYILSGDTSSAASSRTEGFKKYLNEAGWTQEEIDNVKESPSTAWDPATAKTTLQDWIDSTNFTDGTGIYIYCHDDGFVPGIFELLGSASIDSSKLDIIKKNLKAVCGCSYPTDVQELMDGTFASATVPEGCDVFSVTYDPTKIAEATEDLIKSLGGEKMDVDQTIDPTVITKENMDQFTPFDAYEK